VLQSELKLLVQLRTISRYSILFGTFISIPLSFFFPNELLWQVVLALIALAIGTPHGAVDHLITVPKFRFIKMTLFILGYLAVTALAVWFLIANNLLGFQLIVLISAIHFGIGDASFIAEIDNRISRPGLPKLTYALAAGFTPVFLPLLGDGSTQALTAVNPNLIGWALGFESQLFWLILGFNLLAVTVMALRKRWSEVADLLLLLGISLVAPPLVAFAFYFGLWHALRHTGRLTLEYEKSQQLHSQGKSWPSFFKAFNAGIPALLLVVLFTLGWAQVAGFSLPAELLWLLLVVIWALTVPHMALTARLDAKAMGVRS
jgi:Brp/Blh family beta-carotene 15,15'-monooxygenase